MPDRSRSLYARFLLVMMLATFLSPAMGWGMTISHGQPLHADIEMDKAHVGHHHSHNHHPSGQALEDHQAAHSLIGHLLSHMPVDLLASASLAIVKPSQIAPAFLHVPLVPRYLEPPLPPPKVIRA